MIPNVTSDTEFASKPRNNKKNNQIMLTSHNCEFNGRG